MKISVDDVEFFTLNETKKKVLQYDMPSNTYEQTLKNMIFHVINHKFNRCFDRLKKEWEPKVKKEGEKNIPADKEKFAKHIFKRSDYKDRSDRENEKNKSVKIKSGSIGMMSPGSEK